MSAIPRPLADGELLAWIQARHEEFQRARKAGHFGVEFHYDKTGALASVKLLGGEVVLDVKGQAGVASAQRV